MSHQAFLRLAERFERCDAEIGVAPDEDGHLEGVLEAAGEALHALARSRALVFPSAPEWLLKPPKWPQASVDQHTGEILEEMMVVHWATYWWHAVLWLARSRPDAGIVLPAGAISRIEPTRSKGWWDDFGSRVFQHNLHPKASEETRCKLWCQIARASSDVCRFLAATCSRDEPPPDEDEGSRPTQEMDAAASRAPIADRITFTVRWKGHRCVLRNTKPFLLLERLLEAPNQYITVSALLDSVWPNQILEDSTVRTTVRNLKQKLRESGLAALADAIDGSNWGHYAVRLPK